MEIVYQPLQNTRKNGNEQMCVLGCWEIGLVHLCLDCGRGVVQLQLTFSGDVL